MMLLQNPDAVADDLDALVAGARRLLREIESTDSARFFTTIDNETEALSFEHEIEVEVRENEAALGEVLRTLYGRLLLYCDAFVLPETRRSLVEWRARWPDEKIHETHFWHTSFADGRESHALTQILPIVDGLIVLLRPKPSPAALTPVDRAEQTRLEHCLRSIAKIARERGVSPTREAQVQDLLHSHLEGVYSDYTRKLMVAKPLLSFQPDGGIVSLRTAIECKFVGKPEDVAIAMHGLTEDLSGYAGSADWTQFYTLVYMTEPFTTESHVARALGASGNAGTWTTIVVTGPGARLPPRRGRRPPTAPTSPDSGDQDGNAPPASAPER